MKTILVADDDTTIVRLMEMDLLQRGSDVSLRSAGSGEMAISAIEAQKPDVLILDIRMPKGDGFSVLDHVKTAYPDLPVIILTNYRNDEYIQKSKTFSMVKQYIVKHETKMNRVVDLVQSFIA